MDEDKMTEDAWSVVMVPVINATRFESLKNHCSNEIKKLFKEWAENENKIVEQRWAKFEKEFGTDLKTQEQKNNLAQARTYKHAEAVEGYLAGFNKILKGKFRG